eukprot:3550631-Amphidinium_carterae.1
MNVSDGIVYDIYQVVVFAPAVLQIENHWVMDEGRRAAWALTSCRVQPWEAQWLARAPLHLIGKSFGP